MPPWNGLISRLRPRSYARRPRLLLINGLAEQHESWFRNRRFWSRYFEVHAPNILVYEGDALHRRISAKEPITVDYLVRQLHTYADQFVQAPPYHIVASSLGGKVAVEFAARYPELVNRMVLLCPSGMGDKETLPIIDGVVRQDMRTVVRSVFHNPRFVDQEIVRYYRAAIENRRWKKGLLKAVNGTLEESVRHRMKGLAPQTLVVTGQFDRICDPKTAEEAAGELPNGQFLSIPNCGHAPQIEKHWLINRLVVHFLTALTPTAHPRWTQLLLAKPTRAAK